METDDNSHTVDSARFVVVVVHTDAVPMCAWRKFYKYKNVEKPWMWYICCSAVVWNACTVCIASASENSLSKSDLVSVLFLYVIIVMVLLNWNSGKSVKCFDKYLVSNKLLRDSDAIHSASLWTPGAEEIYELIVN